MPEIHSRGFDRSGRVARKEQFERDGYIVVENVLKAEEVSRLRDALVGHFTRHWVPDMLGKGRGAILFTGATAGTRPFATSAAFGPAKFAMRGLAQVMARDLGPQGIHVAYVNVDGAIDMPFIHKLRPELKQDDMLSPAAIAESFWHLAHQDPSAWTQELDVRPFKEKF